MNYDKRLLDTSNNNTNYTHLLTMPQAAGKKLMGGHSKNTKENPDQSLTIQPC